MRDLPDRHQNQQHHGDSDDREVARLAAEAFQHAREDQRDHRNAWNQISDMKHRAHDDRSGEKRD